MSISQASIDRAIPVGRGAYWQDLKPGQVFRTIRRTITETDLVNFIGVTGMLESIFIDRTFEGAIGGRPVPAALTYAIIEGLQLQSLFQETGLAMLELTQQALIPVRVSDTVGATIRVLEVRPTSSSGRAVVSSEVEVTNQNRDTVMIYRIKRLLAGRPSEPD